MLGVVIVSYLSDDLTVRFVKEELAKVTIPHRVVVVANGYDAAQAQQLSERIPDPQVRPREARSRESTLRPNGHRRVSWPPAPWPPSLVLFGHLSGTVRGTRPFLPTGFCCMLFPSCPHLKCGFWVGVGYGLDLLGPFTCDNAVPFVRSASWHTSKSASRAPLKCERIP